jgi:hypothetical protein
MPVKADVPRTMHDHATKAYSAFYDDALKEFRHATPGGIARLKNVAESIGRNILVHCREPLLDEVAEYRAHRCSSWLTRDYPDPRWPEYHGAVQRISPMLV